ncbi:MAG TPA: nuclear transport factor 2 family protein [Ktedonosporobacter sp.]|nr:nuclear transport factor 2 family protein [Ktedonosporobacter sp.]
MDTSAHETISFEEATHLVKRVETVFANADIEGIVAGFTPDVVVRFADFPEMHGRDEAERFIRARFARQKDYRLQKTLRMVSANMIGNYWEGTWEDTVTGKKMCGRGTEFWTLRAGQIALWEATFNVWEDGGKPTTPIT